MCRFFLSNSKYTGIINLQVGMLLACLKPFLVIVSPFIVAWLITSYSPVDARFALRMTAFMVATVVSCGSIFPMMLITAATFGQVVETAVRSPGTRATTMTVGGSPVSGSKTVGLLPYRTGEAPPPLNEMHSRGGEWSGRDYIRPCGTPIVAPYDGSVAGGGIGAIGSWNNTYMYITSDDGHYDMLIMHSDYYLFMGDSFVEGQEIGATNTIGFSSECHEHISMLDNGVTVDPEAYRDITIATPLVAPPPSFDYEGLFSSLSSMGYDGYVGNPLRVSHYDPSLGGTNCDSDCSTMANGQKVASWVGGQGGVYAAACPAEWPFGTRFTLYGRIYQCQDRGGWIKTRSSGEFDPAMGGFVAQETYHWVDLLDTPPVPYGTLIYEWEFVD